MLGLGATIIVLYGPKATNFPYDLKFAMILDFQFNWNEVGVGSR